MRRSKKTYCRVRLAALLLALALLLAGCAAPAEDSSDEPPSASGSLSEISGTAPADELSGGAAVSQDGPDDTLAPSEEEDAALLARMGLVEGETNELTEEHANEIKGAVAGMRAAYVAGPNGKDPLVKERDWSVYTSSISADNLSRGEAAFYDRLNKLCLSYLSSSALSGVKCTFSDGSVWYVTDTVQYDDLGLSKKQAWNIAYWFKWNHPQYYFLTNGISTYSNTLCFQLYDFAVDGEERAEITNELFDKLEDWVQTVADSASTTYQKELCANNLICENNVYHEEYMGNERIDQSLYSSVVMGSTVCAGYSLVFNAMMNALGVDTTVALSDNHAWNVVRFDDGNYYAVDVCWNDTDSKPAYQNDYLNIGEEIMSAANSRKEAHTYSAELAAWIPAIAKESYVPSEEDFQQASDEPVNLYTQEISPTSITLAWSEALSVHTNHRHQYEVGVFADASQKQLYHHYTSELSFTFEPLNPNTSYNFGIRLCCRDDDFTSEWIYLSETTPDGEPYRRSKKPSYVRTIFQDADQAKTVWSGVGGVHDIGSVAEVCQYTDSTYTEMVEGYPQQADSIYGHTWMGLEPGQTYYFGVRSVKKELVDIVYSDWVNFSYTHESNS